MGFVFETEYQRHKASAKSLDNIVLRHQAQAFFNHDLAWDKHLELDQLKSKITPALIDKESSSAGKKVLRFLAGLYPEPTFRGWIYTDTRVQGAGANAALVPFWNVGQRRTIAQAYKRAIDVVDATINVLTVDGYIGNGDELFQDWFGDSGNTAADRVAMATQYKLLRAALGGLRIVSDDVSDRDAVAAAAPWEGMNVIYIGKDFWAPPNMGADDIRRGVELKQVQACIHEWSHKYFSPQTKDKKLNGVTCYGNTLCQQLAGLDPAKAMKNADSVGYFAIDAWWNKYRASAFARGLTKLGANTQLKGAPKFNMI